MRLSRRGFLRLGASAIAAAAVTQIIPQIPETGIEEPLFDLSGPPWVTNGTLTGSTWASKTPAEILSDINALLVKTWEQYEIVPANIVMGKAELEWLRKSVEFPSFNASTRYSYDVSAASLSSTPFHLLDSVCSPTNGMPINWKREGA